MSKVPYAIPKANEEYLQDRAIYAEKIIKKLCNNRTIRNNARLVVGCSIIESEYKFINLLDEGYKSFLIGLYLQFLSAIWQQNDCVMIYLKIQ